ncbi:NAD(P)/FAD-dependent oxidoreductase [Dactylosporangium sp. AC04546]|uniref:NAD(P)/FAD-dependent oxidoreductase n=1 Tax=Dactylosporangium sp. AC04546 TaxID=2862460 RepID=UPI001EDCB079|nr:NAD(P)/FAD-dependent oxidoreductase [Dactylosporangium sp. AC04546]WVK86171.1 NAD(P)/FAD-dependent oxidoreductase [Dactylosporangium sp. AC04546]
MTFDAIVVGARCAGSPTAMLLARQGHRVLLLDRAGFPSDALSTHLIHVPGMAYLRQWGLHDAVVATGAPPHERFTMDFGAFVIDGPPPAVDGASQPYCIRRVLLDKILVDAARDAGAEVREHSTVDGLLHDADGRVTGVRVAGEELGARIVIGADGLHSTVAREVGAGTYDATPALTAGYYAYYRGVSGPGAEIYQLGDRAVVVFPTNDDLACVFVACPIAQFHDFRLDVEGNYRSAIGRVPELAARVEAGERTERIRGTADVPNFFRESAGPGWALVGDAGYHKDPCTASGITDAFTCASMLASAVDHGFASGDLDAAVAGYVKARDERFRPALALTCQLASMEPPPPEMAALLAAVAASPAETTRFLGMMQGSTPVPEYLSPANIGRILSGSS